MTRLCERPGCSAPAAVAYGMNNDHLLVWLELVPDGVTTIRVGMLCRRHADAMVVPRGWTLDDRREPRPRLFRVAEATTANHPSRGRSKPKPRPLGPAEPPLQLAFDGAATDAASQAPDDLSPDDAPPKDAMPDGAGLGVRKADGPVEIIVPDPDLDEVTVGDIRPLDERDPDETQALPWRPRFDHTDDLGGLLRARSPLLSRAFGNREPKPARPESSPAIAEAEPEPSGDELRPNDD